MAFEVKAKIVSKRICLVIFGAEMLNAKMKICSVVHTYLSPIALHEPAVES